MAGGIVNPNSGFQIAYQQNFLARFFEEGLESEMAFRRDAFQELIPIGAGQTITKTRVGRTPPQVNPLNPLNVTGLDNGLTATTPSLEQYVYQVNEYGGLKQVDLLAEQAGIADQLMMNAKLNGVEAAQTVERIAKKTWFAAYNTGNTWVRSDLGSLSTSTVWVDDIRGFQVAPQSGQMQPVSASNPLLVNEQAFQSGVEQSFTVVAAVADAVTRSVYPSSVAGQSSDGISGFLTISPPAGSAPVSGDALVSALATPVIRPNNKQGTNQLTSSDQLTIQLINNAKAVLQQNAVPVHPEDRCYHLYYDYQSENELLVDQQFQIMSASRLADPEDQNGRIFTLMGIKFIPTTEAYLQALNTAAGMQSAPPGTMVHRVLITGYDGLRQGNFAGLESYAQRDGVGSINNIYLVDNIAHIIRSPLDNMGRQVSLAYLTVFAMVCPTDLTTTPAIIPTANNATFKRAVVIEHC
jgi:hypothetical protein